MVNDLDYCMSLPYKTLLIPDSEEGGYAASCPELPGCATCAETLEEVLEMIEDAKHEWLNACLEDERQIPEPGSERLAF